LFYYLFYSQFKLFNLFRYVTFRAAMAAVTAFVICLVVGPYVIRMLKKAGIKEATGKSDSAELNTLHGTKGNVPTMGGIIILAAILISSLLWGRIDNPYLQLGLLCTVGFGIIGFIDDYIKLTEPDKKGLTKTRKLVLQMAISAALAFAVFRCLLATGKPEYLNLYFPFFKDLVLDLSFLGGVGALVITFLVIVFFSNAVNITDGQDGLASGCVVITAAAMAVVCYVVSRQDYADYLFILAVPGSQELTIFCAAMTGAAAGFLWFNTHPAKIFMGDTGALSLGGLLGFIAVASRQEIMLFIVGGVFVIEILSVVIQVASYRFRNKKRVFLIAPLHHHFELKGDPECKVTVRFWIIAGICAVIGLATLKMR